MYFASGEYSQEIPSNVSWEKVSGPPILPPHLLQVILNKDTPLSVSSPVCYMRKFLRVMCKWLVWLTKCFIKLKLHNF